MRVKRITERSQRSFGCALLEEGNVRDSAADSDAVCRYWIFDRVFLGARFVLESVSKMKCESEA